MASLINDIHLVPGFLEFKSIQYMSLFMQLLLCAMLDNDTACWHWKDDIFVESFVKMCFWQTLYLIFIHPQLKSVLIKS